jgi:hypothetical protein
MDRLGMGNPDFMRGSPPVGGLAKPSRKEIAQTVGVSPSTLDRATVVLTRGTPETIKDMETAARGGRSILIPSRRVTTVFPRGENGIFSSVSPHR